LKAFYCGHLFHKTQCLCEALNACTLHYLTRYWLTVWQFISLWYTYTVAQHCFSSNPKSSWAWIYSVFTHKKFNFLVHFTTVNSFTSFIAQLFSKVCWLHKSSLGSFFLEHAIIGQNPEIRVNMMYTWKRIRVNSYHYDLVPGDLMPLCWRLCTTYI